MSDEVVKVLCKRSFAQQQQHDELAWNEIALIATLTKLLPGFDQEFTRKRVAVERLASPRSAEERETVISLLKATLEKHE
jgi:hypothetical protein